MTTITNPTPNVNGNFGIAVAGVGSDSVIIGADWDDTNPTVAYLFSTEGILLTRFTNPYPDVAHDLGRTVVGVGTDKVLIGAQLDGTGARDAGAAYLFSTNGRLLTTITNPTPEADEEFSSAMAAVGTDKVVIGAYDNTFAFYAGAAYLFSTDGSPLTTFYDPTPQANERFGCAVAGVGPDKVLIGALGDDTGDRDAGIAYVFKIDGTLLTTITNPAPERGDAFGAAVAAVGEDKLLIGAPGNWFVTTNPGAAYLFNTNGTLLTTFTNPAAKARDSFGRALTALGTNRVLILGMHNNTNVQTPFAAYLYSTDGALLTTFIPSGDALAGVGADKVLIGINWDNTGATAAGVAHLYTLQPPTNDTHYVNVNNPSPSAPFTSWSTAATNIQDAVDAACPGDTVLVTNGVYAPVTVNKQLSLLSVNGPEVTAINGSATGVRQRCVYLSNGSALSGFTLTNGNRGVLCESTNAVVNNCVITRNNFGGALRATLNNCTLIANTSGGASESTLNNCTLIGNRARFGGGASQSTLNNCVLSGNSASSSGTGLGSGGGAWRSTLNSCILSNNTVVESEDAYGGGAAHSTLNDCILTGNSVSTWALGHFPRGGGAAFSTLNNCTLTGNIAYSSVGDWSGGIGGGVYASMLDNCIVYYNSAPLYPNYDLSALVPTMNYYCTIPLPTNGIGNIDLDPLFVDTNGWSNLRLQSNSPCINAGNNDFVTWSTDLDGNPRILGDTVDLGAHEFVPPKPPTPAELVEHLIALVNESNLRHKQPLLATLRAALASVERGNAISAANQLHAFQNKVRAQVSEPALALQLIQSAAQVIEALGGKDSGRVAVQFQGLKRQPNGRVQLKFGAPSGRPYLVQASTNLVHWETVGLAKVQKDGSYEFEDRQAAKHPRRFYRVVESE